MISPDFKKNPPLILVVDDEKTLRLVLRRAMEKEGYRIAEATNGEQCLESCQQLKPDLVLLDAMMPEMDGFTCCAQLPTLLGDECPAVLMITTLNDKASVDRAFEVGAADYVTKPIDWPVLYQRVRRLLQTRWAMTELRQRIKVQDDLALQMAKQTKDLVAANAALQTEIAERKQAEEQIKASLKEKEVLLKEIHHRVKNNLQIISSLLKLQARSIKDIQTLEIFNESQSRIRTMALIHESLYQSNDLSKINFAEYLRKLAANLFRSYEITSSGIKQIINVNDVFLEIDVAVPCGLIINELVSNSLKYAFPSGNKGEIKIELYSDKNRHFTLIVSDNGIGLPKDLDLQKTKTLGLQLVNNLVDQLEGSCEVDSNGGTEFKIKFTC
jgi:two-component sensor histidine kinase/CheY-like chemotaxis protein